MRAALNGLELAVSSTPKNKENQIVITIETAEECMQKKSFSHDKGGDAHYDVLSAFQKSIRGSDVNASLHYLGRLIEAGDLDSIARRMIVIAYEDIGLANPQAGPRAIAAVEAAERLGFPEARIPLSVAIVELALSPKSNSSYKALDHALRSEEHTSELQSRGHLVCRLLLEKKKETSKQVWAALDRGETAAGQSWIIVCTDADAGVRPAEAQQLEGEVQ